MTEAVGIVIVFMVGGVIAGVLVGKYEPRRMGVGLALCTMMLGALGVIGVSLMMGMASTSPARLPVGNVGGEMVALVQIRGDTLLVMPYDRDLGAVGPGFRLVPIEQAAQTMWGPRERVSVASRMK